MLQAETSLNRIIGLIQEINKYQELTKGQVMRDAIENRLNEELKAYEHDLSLGVKFLNNRPDTLRLLRSINRGSKDGQ